ncbi:MAG: hypothetical protein Q9160_002894 [Pyrenula sp. 1 TL-2023]
MIGSPPRYTILPGDEEDSTLERKESKERKRGSMALIRLKSMFNKHFYFIFAYTLFTIANILTATLTVLYISHQRDSLGHNSAFPQTLYSPAQDAISYQLNTFESGFHQSDFTGKPTPDLDARWRSLYRVGNSRITKSEAAQLPNKTIAAVAGLDDDYLVVISVFHDLHCLDRLRQALWYFHDPAWNQTSNPFLIPRPPAYAPNGLNGIVHLDHCINIIRQSLQCFSDVTPYVFQWNERAQEVQARADVVHTCRDFDMIRDWGRSRTYTDPWVREGYRDEQGVCGSGNDGECPGI